MSTNEQLLERIKKLEDEDKLKDIVIHSAIKDEVLQILELTQRVSKVELEYVTEKDILSLISTVTLQNQMIVDMKHSLNKLTNDLDLIK